MIIPVTHDGRFDGQSLNLENESLKIGKDLDGSSMKNDLASRRDSRNSVVKYAVYVMKERK